MILAIDDDKSMLSFYGTALAEFGKVKTALSMAEARGQLADVALILLDVHLGEGQTTVQQNLLELKAVAPVLLCSGLQDPMVQAIGRANGAAGYWNKGTDHQGLVALVKAVFAKKARPSATEGKGAPT